MTLAEFTVAVDKRVAWSVLFKAAAALITCSFAVFSALIVPVLFVNTLKYRADENDKTVARLEEQFKELARTNAGMQVAVAELKSEVKANRSDNAAIKAGIDQLLQQRSAALPPRTANPPTRRAAQ